MRIIKGQKSEEPNLAASEKSERMARAREAKRKSMDRKEHQPMPSTSPGIIKSKAFTDNPDFTLPAHGWECRPYQQAAWDYMTSNTGKRKLCVLNWHRRAGKDFFLLNLIAYLTTKRKGTYWHVFPQLKQGKRAIWNDFTKDEIRKLDYIPEGMRLKTNEQQLRIDLITGSVYMIMGADDPDNVLGSGPVGVGFSEYSTMRSKMWDLISPMLAENKGWAIFISTPRGKNHFYKLYEFARENPDCFAQTLTIADTYYLGPNNEEIPVIDQEYLDQERKMGKSEQWIQQEYYGSWEAALDGSVYAKELSEMESSGRIGSIEYRSDLPVYTATDLGYRDETVILFYQITPAGEVFIFDMIVDSNQAIAYYCKKIHERGYRQYEFHWVGWDVGHKTINTGNSTLDTAREHGIQFRRCPRHLVNDGIESVRANFPRIYINKEKCQRLINAIKSYRFEWNEENRVFSEKPEHDEYSHAADSLRYLCFTLPKLPELVQRREVEKRSIHIPEPDDTPWDITNPIETVGRNMHNPFFGFESNFQPGGFDGFTQYGRDD